MQRNAEIGLFTKPSNHDMKKLAAYSRDNQTPQALPLKPTITLPFSTITGTFRLPSEYFSMVSRLLASVTTLIYSTSPPFFAYASRAAVV